jgi:hypothetical protein
MNNTEQMRKLMERMDSIVTESVPSEIAQYFFSEPDSGNDPDEPQMYFVKDGYVAAMDSDFDDTPEFINWIEASEDGTHVAVSETNGNVFSSLSGLMSQLRIYKRAQLDNLAQYFDVDDPTMYFPKDNVLVVMDSDFNDAEEIINWIEVEDDGTYVAVSETNGNVFTDMSTLRVYERVN